MCPKGFLQQSSGYGPAGPQAKPPSPTASASLLHSPLPHIPPPPQPLSPTAPLCFVPLPHSLIPIAPLPHSLSLPPP